MTSHPELFLNSKQAKHFDGRHPWVLERSIIEPTAGIEAGCIVELLHPTGAWIGRGVYNPHSRIRLRLYQWDRSATLDAAWVCSQLRQSVEMRHNWMKYNQPLDAVRLVNSEGDGLSGLVVDQFGGYLVMQITSLAIAGWVEVIREWLVEQLKPQGVFLRIDAHVAANEGIEACDELSWGQAPSGPIELRENEVRLQVDLTGSQKTGYYLDQRANRLRTAKWISGGSMLDVCCYQGGFSLAASRWGNPSEIVAVDSSQRALDQARLNATENGFSNINFIQEDCFDVLERLVKEGAKYQTVVLDPPRMASNRQQISAALRAYHRLNLSAVNLLEPGGILVSCSCSGRVKRADFMGVLASVAKRTRRQIQILESHGADFDHPINVSCPESEYLKCFICRVL